MAPTALVSRALIHSLVLARHAVETGELDTYSTSIGGEAVDLGGFWAVCVSARTRGNRVEWAIEPECPQLQRTPVQNCGEARRNPHRAPHHKGGGGLTGNDRVRGGLSSPPPFCH